MAVYDYCMFLNENDLFELKINQHWNFVDKFIVIEAGETHTGLKKTFNFDQERFKKYSEKIIYVTFDNFEEEMKKPENQILINIWNNQPNQPDAWKRDNFQGNYIIKVLQELGAKDDDIIYGGSIDELLKEEAFYEALKLFAAPAQWSTAPPKWNFSIGSLSTKDILSGKALYEPYQPEGHPLELKYFWEATGKPQLLPTKVCRPIVGFHMDWYAYKFNLKSHIKSPMGLLAEHSTYKQLLPSTMRHMGLSTHKPIGSPSYPAGWHFTFLDDSEGDMTKEKQRSWAHSEDKDGTYADWGEINEKEELVLRLFIEHRLQKEEIKPGIFPQFLLDNLDKFKNYLYTGSVEEYIKNKVWEKYLDTGAVEEYIKNKVWEKYLDGCL